MDVHDAARNTTAAELTDRLNTRGKVIAEYIWLGGSGTDLRSQAKVLDTAPTDLGQLPDWHVDGSCSGLALADDYYVYLKPQAYYPDPFRGGDNLLVLCGTYVLKEDTNELVPHATNNRSPCENIMEMAAGSQPKFSAHQEYTITNPATSWIVSSSVGSIPLQGAPSYGGTATSPLQSRGQWVYHLGPCVGVGLADELWVSRYLLLRAAEMQNLNVTFDPEPVPSNLQPLSCALEYSTFETQQPGSGIDQIHKHIELLRQNHIRHVAAYGKGYLQRLSIPSQDLLRQRSREFSSGYGSKLTSIMIPHSTRLNRCGHYIDQRPASNMDPYLVTALLVSTTLGVPLRAAAHNGGGNGHGSIGPRPVEQVIDDAEFDDGDAGAWEEAFINEIAFHEPIIPDTPPLNRCFTFTAVPQSIV